MPGNSLNVKFSVAGIQEQIKALDAISRRVKGAAMRKALRAMGGVIKDRVGDLVPVDTGLLKSDIGVDVKQKGASGSVKIGPMSGRARMVDRSTGKAARGKLGRELMGVVKAFKAARTSNKALSFMRAPTAFGVAAIRFTKSRRTLLQLGGKKYILKDPAKYEHFAELGTVKEAARPFIRPALDEKKDEALRAGFKVLEEALRHEVSE